LGETLCSLICQEGENTQEAQETGKRDKHGEQIMKIKLKVMKFIVHNLPLFSIC
jgi:hypothetical protein